MPIRRMLSLARLLPAFLLAALSASAAAPPNSPFIVNSWSVENGLPDNAVIAIVQAPDGYLWLGTQYGLVRFDGSQFNTFNEMNTPGLKSDRVVFLYEDKATNLWIGTESAGLAVIQNGIVKNFEAETAKAGPVTTATENSGDILFYSGNGITRYSRSQINFYAGVYSQQAFLLANHWLIPSRNGGMWELQSGSVQKWQDGKLVKNLGPWPWGNAPIKAACEDAGGNLIIGTLGSGIFWFDAGGHCRRISTADGLSSDYILSLSVDREGNLWAGTDGGGLNRIKQKLFNTPENFHSWAAQSLSEDAGGGLWAAFGASGAAYWRSNSTKDFQIGRSRQAWEVLADSRQHVWIGSRDEGLFLFQGGDFSAARGAEILGQKIFALYESHDGKIWAGALNGLGCWDGQNWKLYTIHDGLPENAVRAIAEDSRSNVWVGTQNNGLDYFSGGKFTACTNGLPGSDISCLYVDRDGVLWVGTAGHGLACLEFGQWKKFKSFSTQNGLASDSIGYIIDDAEGYLWVGSNRGLMRIKKDQLTGATNESAAVFCRVYGTADGLPTPECSSGSQPAAIRGHNGQLWFPTVAGAVSIAPAQLQPNRRPPQVLIESVLVDLKEQNTNPLNSAWSPAITMPAGAEQLEIHYTALNFSAPQNVRFKYRLAGRQTGWTDAGDGRVARYIDLPPGHYTFYVTACNEDGTWNPTGAALDITMSPQFWQTLPFQAVAIIVALAVIIGTVRYVSTQKLQRELQQLREKEALERERARIARDLHDQLGANLTQVALLGELAEADKDLPDEVASHSQQISQTARETTRSLDEIVWAINPSNDTLEGLANYVCKYAQEYLALASLPCRIDVPAQLPAAAIPPEVRHNVFLAFKEAVNNVVKHSQATEVQVRLRLQPKRFTLQVQDNGRGMNPQAPTTRNGLRNMKKRMADIGGDFSVSSGSSGGTLIELTAPLNP